MKNHLDTEKVMAMTVLALQRPFTLTSVTDGASTTIRANQVCALSADVKFLKLVLYRYLRDVS